MRNRITIAVYDLESNKYRRKTQSACENYGLKRFQYSGYVGKISGIMRKKLFDEVRAYIKNSKRSGRILVMPVCESDFDSAFVYEEAESDDDEEDGWRYLC